MEAEGSGWSWGSLKSALRNATSDLAEGLGEFTSQLEDDTEGYKRDIEGETARAQEVLQMQADTVRKTLDEGVKQTVIKASQAADTLNVKASQAADTLNVKASQAVDLMEMLTPKAAASVGASSSNSTSSSHRKQRYQDKVRSLQADPQTYSSEPALEADAFQAWRLNFDLLSRTDEIESLLKSAPHIRTHHSQFVPAHITYRCFWERYFFRLHRLEQEEERRHKLLDRSKAQTSTSSVDDWEDFDEDDWDTPVVKPAALQARKKQQPQLSSPSPGPSPVGGGTQSAPVTPKYFSKQQAAPLSAASSLAPPSTPTHTPPPTSTCPTPLDVTSATSACIVPTTARAAAQSSPPGAHMAVEDTPPAPTPIAEAAALVTADGLTIAVVDEPCESMKGQGEGAGGEGSNVMPPLPSSSSGSSASEEFSIVEEEDDRVTCISSPSATNTPVPEIMSTPIDEENQDDDWADWE